ncbi:MAG: hypothetical protein D6767_09750 [Candidatus Hydrogenedentota bacterium]|nr:MAG: hypothetical protein D6767_09750 [Candidatus Hydrogenedentota bacterium]
MSMKKIFSLFLLFSCVQAMELPTRNKLSEKDASLKKEGGFFTGVPLLAYSTDIGFAYGARAYYYFNGKKENPLFYYTPYFHRVYAQFLQSTRGLKFHTIDYDAPYFLGSPLRLSLSAIYSRNIVVNYFSRYYSQFPSPDDSFGGIPKSYNEYKNKLNHVYNGYTYSKFTQTDIERWRLYPRVGFELLEGKFRPFVGMHISRVFVRDYSFTKNGENTEGKTLLLRDAEAGRVIGFGGGWDNSYRLALIYDTRDFEPDPKHGILTGMTFSHSTAALGSSFEYVGITGEFRVYEEIFSGMVLAFRFALHGKTGNVPFFGENFLVLLDSEETYLGGARSLRGFVESRFRGNRVAFANLEFRYHIIDFTLGKEHFGVILVPFIDAGETRDAFKQFIASGIEVAGGFGIRIPWNLATIIMIDTAFSREGMGNYIMFNHIF